MSQMYGKFPSSKPRADDDTDQATTLATNLTTLPTLAANAGKSIRNLIQDQSSIQLGAPVRRIDRDLF